MIVIFFSAIIFSNVLVGYLLGIAHVHDKAVALGHAKYVIDDKRAITFQWINIKKIDQNKINKKGE